MKKKIQSKLEALAHPEIWSNEDWLVVAVKLKTTARLLHSTNNKEENIKVGGQYKHKYWVGIIGQLKIENSIYQITS